MVSVEVQKSFSQSVFELCFGDAFVYRMLCCGVVVALWLSHILKRFMFFNEPVEGLVWR